MAIAGVLEGEVEVDGVLLVEVVGGQVCAAAEPPVRFWGQRVTYVTYQLRY